MKREPAGLDAVWYGGAPIPLWMRGAEVLYCLARPVHQAWQAFRSGHPGVPVVVVGNITAGGTGKTPLLMHLVQQLVKRGHRPGVVSRGYGSKGRGLREVCADSDAVIVGDEPLLIHRQTGVPVMVHVDRLEAARELVRRHGVEVVVSDDGLQHRRLRRDLEIAVVDGERGLGNGHQLPAGPLREPPGRLDQVDFVVRHGGTDAHMTLSGSVAINLASGRSQPLTGFSDRSPLHAVAGIGRPQRFFEMLEAAGLAVAGHALPDHHGYPDGDPVLALSGPVLTTSKDAVKLRGRVGENWWEVPVDTVLDPGLAQRVLTRIEELIDRG